MAPRCRTTGHSSLRRCARSRIRAIAGGRAVRRRRSNHTEWSTRIPVQTSPTPRSAYLSRPASCPSGASFSSARTWYTAVLHGPVRSLRVVARPASRSDQIGSALAQEIVKTHNPSRLLATLGLSERRRRRHAMVSRIRGASWQEGGAYGHAFEDQARCSTTPTSRATPPGSASQEGTAERGGESFDSPISSGG